MATVTVCDGVAIIIAGRATDWDPFPPVTTRATAASRLNTPISAKNVPLILLLILS